MVDVDWLMSGEFSHILFVEFVEMISYSVCVHSWGVLFFGFLESVS